MQHSPSIPYRSDIDGLRALAVIIVVLFHAFPNVIPGGFIGVDIFFVISGYLITGIIHRGVTEQRFSLITFYARRIKRLYPALLVVFAFSLAYGWLVLLPHEFKQLGRQMISAALYVINFRLYKESGYFDAAASTKPLLHMWSLSIEEQFYLLWPLIMLLTLRYLNQRWLRIMLGMILMGSFVWNIWLITRNPTGTFYWPMTRFWELLLGAALALVSKQPCSMRYSHVMSAVGLVLIGVALITFHEAQLFPGWRALVPTIGAALLIASGNNGWVNRAVLSHPWMVGIGLISYPLYLWHWPLMSYAHIIAGAHPAAGVMVTLIVVALILATLTYSGLERPVRQQGSKMAVWLFVLMIPMIGLGHAAGHEWIRAYAARKPEVSRIVAAVGDWEYPGKAMTAFQFQGQTFHRQGDNSRIVLFIGDSNIEQYYPRIDYVLRQSPSGHAAVFASRDGCPAFPHVRNHKQQHCIDSLGRALAYAKKQEVKTVVIGSQWLEYVAASSTYFYERQGEQQWLYPGSIGLKHAYDDFGLMIASLKSQGKRVVVVLNIPVGDVFSPVQLIRRDIWGNWFDTPHAVSKNQWISVSQEANQQIAQLAKAAGAEVVNPTDYLCDNQSCPVTTRNGIPIYKDATHLRPFFVRESVTFLDDVMGIGVPI